MARTTGTRKQADTRPAPTIPEEEVAKVAYALFERRGCTPGGELEDWLEAERIVRSRRRRP